MSKDEIYAYAINHHIPFLVDSTPSWSKRGKLRDNVKPALQSVSACYKETFVNLAQHLQECHLWMMENVNTCFERLQKDGYIEVKRYPKSFWRELFKRISPHKLVSHKSIENFNTYILNGQNKKRSFVLHKALSVNVENNKMRHYVRNPTGKRRIVLFIDVVRRDLSPFLSLINNLTIGYIEKSPILKNFNKNQHNARPKKPTS